MIILGYFIYVFIYINLYAFIYSIGGLISSIIKWTFNIIISVAMSFYCPISLKIYFTNLCWS